MDTHEWTLLACNDNSFYDCQRGYVWVTLFYTIIRQLFELYNGIKLLYEIKYPNSNEHFTNFTQICDLYMDEQLHCTGHLRT